MKKYIYFLLWYIAVVYWFIRRPYTYGASVIVEDGKNILLVRHTYGHRKLWGLPGGHKKRSENDKDCASRELLEETGIDSPIKKLGVVKMVEDYRNSNEAVFLANFNNQVIRLDRAEIQEFRWWPENSLPMDMSPSTKAALKLYLG